MNIPIGVIISILMGALGLGSALVTVGIYIGGFKSKFLTKEEYEKGRKSCLIGRDKVDEQARSKAESIEARVIHRIELVEAEHNKVINSIFEKINEVFRQMEELKLDVMKIQTTILANEKSGR